MFFGVDSLFNLGSVIVDGVSTLSNPQKAINEPITATKAAER